METIVALAAFKRLKAGLEILGGECLTDLNKSGTAADHKTALETIHSRLGAVQRDLNKLLETEETS